MRQNRKQAGRRRFFLYAAALICLFGSGLYGNSGMAQADSAAQSGGIMQAGRAAVPAAPVIDSQAAPPWQTITSLAESSKYARSFPHYDYVNPQAPKGGSLNKVIIGSFNSLNPYIIEGQVPAGLMPFGGGLLYETLMDQSLEEDGVSYPAVAEALQYPADDSWVKFRLNRQARWHDGAPIEADDVIWSFNVLRKISPYYSSYYAQVEKAEQTAPHEVKFTFKTAGNRELPKIMGDLPVLPRHWWEGRDNQGRKRDIARPGLEIPLGSGAYKIAEFAAGKYIVWQRVANAWGARLPQNIGRNNYDFIRYNYILDNNAEWEAFKKGGLSDYIAESRIGRWQSGYNFAAVRQGAVKRAEFPYFSGVYQAYYFNTRRAKFADKRVRQALTLALDFEAINSSLFFNKYQRAGSYYGAQAVASGGAPQGRTRQILREMQARFPYNVPQALFDEEFRLPVYKSASDSRKYLGQAMRLLQQAGWHLRDNQLLDKEGRPFSVEFLLSSADFQRPTAFYAANLRKLGIEATMRTVDSSQYANRLNNFDFDIIMAATLQSSSPGNEQADYFGSVYAGRAGSRNYAGIKNPAIDNLIAHLLQAQTRAEIVATAQAMDLALRWNYYSAPAWRSLYLYLAYWDKFGRPATQPRRAAVDIFSWWVDKDKERTLKAAGYAAGK